MSWCLQIFSNRNNRLREIAVVEDIIHNNILYFLGEPNKQYDLISVLGRTVFFLSNWFDLILMDTDNCVPCLFTVYVETQPELIYSLLITSLEIFMSWAVFDYRL